MFSSQISLSGPRHSPCWAPGDVPGARKLVASGGRSRAWRSCGWCSLPGAPRTSKASTRRFEMPRNSSETSCHGTKVSHRPLRSMSLRAPKLCRDTWDAAPGYAALSWRARKHHRGLISKIQSLKNTSNDVIRCSIMSYQIEYLANYHQ